MGNGASVHQNASVSKSASVQQNKIEFRVNDDFRTIEKLCNRGYFASHTESYKDEFERAIRVSQLDNLEVLIKVGLTRDLYPLHLAAKHGSIDSVELLVSAGGYEYHLLYIHHLTIQIPPNCPQGFQ